MKRVRPDFGRAAARLVLAALLGHGAGGACAADPLPDASEVTRRMIERAQAVARAERGPAYACEKRAVLEHLDAAGHTTKSEEKLYEVTWIAGFPFNRLVKVQGRALTGEDLKKEQQREERFRARYVATDAKKMAARKEAWVTAHLLDRYEFTVLERVQFNDRPTLVLNFRPKPGQLPAKAIHDKILNQMAGTVWVDEADADAAKLTARLTDTVSMGVFGVLGSLSRCDLSLERRRTPEGVWVNLQQTLLVHCRKLAVTSRFRSIEDSSGFKKVTL